MIINKLSTINACIVVLFNTAISKNCFASDKFDGLYDAIKDNLELSYFTAGGGFDNTDNIKFGDMYFEGQIYAHFNFLNTNLKTNPDHIFLSYFPIRLQVRQFTSNSSPVKTPSYNPGVRLFYTNKNWIEDKDDSHYVSIGFHHYSNGQNGPHNDPTTGLINTETGSFSSDYLELSYYRIDQDATFFWKKANYRAYLTSLTWEPEQDDLYQTGVFELSGKMKVDGVHDTFPKIIESSYLQLTTAYKLGRDFIRPGVGASTSDNMQYTAEWITKPVGWEDISLYVRWDKGFDNYNINYQNKINRIQIGIVARN